MSTTTMWVVVLMTADLDMVREAADTVDMAVVDMGEVAMEDLVGTALVATGAAMVTVVMGPEEAMKKEAVGMEGMDLLRMDTVVEADMVDPGAMADVKCLT